MSFDPIEINLSPMAPPLHEQINKQSPEGGCGEIGKFENIRFSINMLSIHGYITPSQTQRACKKLLSAISGEIK